MEIQPPVPPQPAAFDVIVIGAGAAGLFAASAAASRGRKTLLLEKNTRPGVKILMSGGTRCNITQAGDAAEVADAFGRRQGRFLRAAFTALPPDEVIALVNALGVATKVEAGGKVFPQSNKASDVLAAFLQMLKRSGAELATDEPVLEVTRGEDCFAIATAKRRLTSRSLILTVGGKSYPGSGTSGDGYAWAESLGHTIVPTHAALTPITTRDAWVPELSGVTIEDASLRVETADGDHPFSGKQRRLEREPQRRGSLLLTHFGLSGPAALDVSRAISGCADPMSLQVACDWLPGRTIAETEALIQTAAGVAGGRTIASLVGDWLPRRLADQMLELAGVPGEQNLAELSRESRGVVARQIHEFAFRVQGVRGYKKAEVTMGGVDLNEIDSRTMQSKRTPGLFFAGEILDIDGPIGGYNFQAAFSTGRLAGENA